MSSTSREYQLLLVCARVGRVHKDIREIQQIIAAGIDWRFLLREAIDHGLVYHAQHQLLQAPPDLVPEGILAGLQAAVNHTRASNRAVIDAMMRIVEYLATRNVDAIAFDGPCLLMEAYADIGVRTFDRIRLLVRHKDLASARAALGSLGYRGDKRLPEPQIDLIQYLSGSEKLIGTGQIPIELHTETVPRSFALDIDYGGIWQRVASRGVNGRPMFSLAREDSLIWLSVACGLEGWRDISRTCDFAALMAAYADLNWEQVFARARSQKCLRMLSWSIDLACTYFGAPLPNEADAVLRIGAAARSALQDIATNWYVEAPLHRKRGAALLLNRPSPHDTFAQRARFAARTLLSPSPEDIESVSLPESLSPACLPLAAAYRVLSGAPRQIYRRLKYSRMKLILVCGPWGSGTTAVAGMLEALGAQGFGRYFRTGDERTPVTFEAIAFRTTVQRYVSEDTLARRADSGAAALNGLRRLRREIELQRHSSHNPFSPAPIFLKYPLSALLLPEICEVFDTRLVYVIRPVEEIERSRARRGWRANLGRVGAEVVYGAMEHFAKNQARPILRITYATLLAATAECARELADFAGLKPDPSSLQRAIEFVGSNRNDRGMSRANASEVR